MRIEALSGEGRGVEGALARLARVRPQSPFGAILIGLIAAAGGLFLRWAGSAFYGEVTGFIILLPAVVLAALAGGRLAGVVATVAALLGGWWLVGPDGVGVGLATPMGRIATVNFVIVGLFVTLIAGSLRKTVARLDRSIEALRRSSERISDTESQLAVISEQAPAMLWMSDETGQCVHLNQAQREFWNPPGSSETFDWSQTLHPDDAARVAEVGARAAARHERFEIDARYRRHDGAWRVLHTDARPRLSLDGRYLGMIGINTDVTEARAMEAALRESEARFRLMADNAPAPIWLTNRQAEVEFVNAALVDFYGRPREELLGHVWKQAMHPDDIAAVAAAQAGARDEHQPYSFECRFRRADGEWRWMRVAVNPRFDAMQGFLGYVGMSFDVTETRIVLEAMASQERRQSFLLALTDRLRDLSEAEQIMAEVERALGDVLGAERVGYGEVDQERGIVSMTRDWTAGVASAQGQFSLHTFGADLISDLSRGRVIRIPDVRLDPRTAAVADAFASIETRALVRAPLVRGGRLRAFLYVHAATVRDWTPDEVELVQEVAERTWAEVERARAEAELRESEQRFRAIADTAPVLIWVTNRDRERSFVNQAYVDYMGGGYEAARTADWQSFIHPDDQARLVEASVAGEATGAPFSLEARYLRHDGQYRWLKSFSRPRYGAENEVIGYVGVAFDVTEAKKAEVDLKRINELLEERVGDALAEKARAEADLMHAQRMEAVGRLTGGVAHDFNNLLTVVIGALDIILRSDNPTKSRKLAEAALSAARRGEGLTHQLLAFSRRQTLRPQPTDLNALIREGAPLLRRAVGEAIEFDLKLMPGGARVRVDPAQFEAALLNLVVNARDAVGDRGSITVRTTACKVAAGQIAELPEGDYVCVTVTDDGPGMAPEIIDRVFEPFFTTKPIGKGTGLGLSQVYGFARQSGGGVGIASTLGKGTDIRLYLPPLVGAAETIEAAPAAIAGEVAGRSILLVEDDGSVAAIATDLLREFGLEVTAVETAPDALAALKTRRFDLMLTDIVMPGGMTGVELGRICARTYPHTRIILTSGYAGDDVDAALADAPWPFLRKPYSGEQLRRLLVETLHLQPAPAV